MARKHMWDNWTNEEYLRFINYANRCCTYNFRKILRDWFKHKDCLADNSKESEQK